MHQDVVDLAAFYQSPLGQVAARMIQRQALRLWPDVRGQALLGLGYAPPVLAAFAGQAERALAAMPAPQGVVPWPAGGPGRVALSDPDRLPFPDYSFDRVVVAHGLEFTEDRTGLMQEVWRVMAAGGRLLMVVPNRRGIWARVDRTPFGHGQPYSASQLVRLLKDNHFAPEATTRALFLPPVRLKMLMGAAAAWEEAGSRWFPGFSGVVMIEASKQVYRLARPAERVRQRPLLVPIPGAATARIARSVETADPNR